MSTWCVIGISHFTFPTRSVWSSFYTHSSFNVLLLRKWWVCPSSCSPYTLGMQSISESFGFYSCIYPESSPLLLLPLLSIWSSLIFVISLLNCCSSLSLGCLLPFHLLYGLSSTQHSDWTCSSEPDLITALFKLLHSYQSESQNLNSGLQDPIWSDLAPPLASCSTTVSLAHSSQTTLASELSQLC